MGGAGSGRSEYIRIWMQGVQSAPLLRERFGSHHPGRLCAVQAEPRIGVSLAPPTGQVAMSSRVLIAGALLALVAASALFDHSVADARRLDSTVVVGRVTSNGRAVPGVTITIAGRATSTISASDGRYALVVARAGQRDRVTLLARRIGYRAVAASRSTSRATPCAWTSCSRRRQSRSRRWWSTNAPQSTPRGTARGRGQPNVSTSRVPTASIGMAASPAAMAKVRARRDGFTVPPGIRRAQEPWNTEAYDRIDENPFRPVSVAPLSTFSVDVDRASYSNVRRFLNQGALPPKDAVRIEELVNYFPYGDATPSSRDVPLRITTEIAAAPWNSRHDLLRIALRAREVDMRRAPASQPRVPRRRLRLDAGSRPAAARQAVARAAGERAARGGSRRDRRLRGRGGSRAALHARQRQAAHPRRARGARGGRLDRRWRGNPARVRRARGRTSSAAATTASSSAPTATSTSARRATARSSSSSSSVAPRARSSPSSASGWGTTRTRRWRSSPAPGTATTATSTTCSRRARCSCKEMGGTLVTVAKDVKLQVEFNPGAGAGLPAPRLRGPTAARRGLRQRREGRGRRRRGTHRDRAVRDRARRRAARRDAAGDAARCDTSAARRGERAARRAAARRACGTRRPTASAAGS